MWSFVRYGFIFDEGFTAKLFIEKLEKRLANVGNPEIFIGDRGSQFLSCAMDSYKKISGAEFYPSVAYHHQGNALVENKTKTAKALLHAKIKEGYTWKKALSETEKICTKELVSDSTGHTSFEIRTGYKYEDGFDRLIKKELERKEALRKEVMRNKDEASERQKEYYDKGKKNRSFEVGDRVMVTDNKKTSWHQEKRKGPYLIEKKLENNNYLLKNLISLKYEMVNVEMMILCKLDEFEEYKRLEEERESKDKGVKVKDIKNNIKDKEKVRGVKVGDRVNVWFEDKQKYFRGEVVRGLGEDVYDVRYDVRSEGIEEVVLDEKNRTRDKNNEDRWNIITTNEPR